MNKVRDGVSAPCVFQQNWGPTCMSESEQAEEKETRLEDGASESQAGAESSTVLDPSGDSTSNEQESQAEQQNQAPGTPWVDYIPKVSTPWPIGLEEWIEFMIDTNQEILTEKEYLRMYFVEHQAHPSYNTLWIKQSAGLFRTLVRHKNRLSRIKEKKASK